MFLDKLFKKEEKTVGVKKDKINIKDLLTDEEIRILVTDLGLIENTVNSEQSSIIVAAKELAQSGAKVAPQILDLYIAAVQSALDMFSKFNMVPSGTSALLEKLQSAKNSLNN